MPAWDFDATTYTDSPTKSSFDPLPAGDYTAIITDSDMKDTKAGTGKYIELSMQVVEGQYEGRRLWERLNVYNPSEQAERIARSQLNQLSAAVGRTGTTDTESLHDIPFVISLDIDRREPTRNKVMGYSAAGKARPAAPKAAPATAEPGKKAWER
jgi:hypothetical protein